MVYSKTNCDGYKEEGITYPAGKVQKVLLKEFYEDINVDPSTINYVEAHGRSLLKIFIKVLVERSSIIFL